MKILRTLQRLADPTRENLARAARDLGHEMPLRHLALLSRFRGLVATLTESSDPYVEGYRACLREVTAAYEAAVEARMRQAVERMTAYVGDEPP